MLASLPNTPGISKLDTQVCLWFNTRMDKYYQVWHPEYGAIVKNDDNIKAARAWAKKAFPRVAVTVSRAWQNRRCDDCQCAPCCCMVREDA